MKLGLRVALIAVLVLQAWYAVVLTRYERLYQTGQIAFNAWDAESALEYFHAARDVHDSEARVWRRSGDMALYIHDYPGQVPGEHDPAEMLESSWESYVGAVLRCPVDSWSWSGVAEVAVDRVELREQAEGIDLAELELRKRGILDPYRAVALAAARLAVQLKPAGFQELDVLARVYHSIGDLEKANRTYAQSARMMPVASFHVWGEGKRLHEPVYTAILEGLQDGIESAPPFERSLLNREIARFARSQGDLETAVVHAKLAEDWADRNFEFYAANWELARALEALGRYEEAVEAIKIARANLEDPSALSRKQGTLELLTGNAEDACVNLRKALRIQPDDERLRLQAAHACESAGEPALTEHILQDGYVVPTDNLRLARALLDFHRRQGHDELAEYLVTSWARDFPDREEFQLWAESDRRREP